MSTTFMVRLNPLFTYVHLTQVSDPRHVPLRAGSAHDCRINCVAENRERDFYMQAIVSNIPKRGKKKKKQPNP